MFARFITRIKNALASAKEKLIGFFTRHPKVAAGVSVAMTTGVALIAPAAAGIACTIGAVSMVGGIIASRKAVGGVVKAATLGLGIAGTAALGGKAKVVIAAAAAAIAVAAGAPHIAVAIGMGFVFAFGVAMFATGFIGFAIGQAHSAIQAVRDRNAARGVEEVESEEIIFAS